jgi:hypothetical protein
MGQRQGALESHLGDKVGILWEQEEERSSTQKCRLAKAVGMTGRGYR